MKERLFSRIVSHRISIIIAFALLTAASLIMSAFVKVDYDIDHYLPENTPSTVALNTLKSEFNHDIPNAHVMVKDVTIPQALQYKEKLARIDGVTAVTWLDDVISLDTPLTMYPEQTVSSYYSDGSALFTLTIATDQRVQAWQNIREVIGEENAMTGSAIATATATASTVSEVHLITVLAILFLLALLLLTTYSWVEPLVVLLGLAAGVAINSGTNLCFGTISFVTNAAGTILQLAISLDFSVFLFHRYKECRSASNSTSSSTPRHPAADMVQALCKTSTTIFSSGATVMIGFLALTVMDFKIGPDLGFVLAKGIAISIVTVFTLVPSLYLCSEKLLEKTAHRQFFPSFQKFGKLVSRSCVAFACLFVALPIPAFLASTSEDISYRYGSEFIFGDDTTYGRDTAQIHTAFGQSDTYMLMLPTGDIPRETQLSHALQDIDAVESVISYVDSVGTSLPKEIIGSDILEQLESENYSAMILNVRAQTEGEETFTLVEEIRDTAQNYYPDTYRLAGSGVSTTDLMHTITHDKSLVDVIAAAAVLIVLLFATRSLSLPVILVSIIETAIWANFAIPYFTGSSVFYLSYLIVSAVQLGVTVDYAILLADRYVEARRTKPKKTAIIHAVSVSTIPVLTSGLMLTVVGFAMSAVSSHGVLAMLGHFLGVGTLMSLFCVIFILPGFLCICDRLIGKTTWRARFLETSLTASTK